MRNLDLHFIFLLIASDFKLTVKRKISIFRA